MNPTKEQIEALISECAVKYGVPVELAMKQCAAESSFNPDARSAADCYGLFQLSRGTARDLGVDRTDWRQNVDGGIRYDAQLYRRFKDWPKAFAAFNWGMGNVKTCCRTYGAAWLEHVPKETRNYVRKITGI